MRGLWSLVIICVLIFQTPTEAFLFQKKDYKQIMLNYAYNAEKRKDYKSAFRSYEKAMYYYKKDRKVLESYAKFCERRNYLDKAEELYSKLYLLTKDKQYLFKVYICSIKNGKFSNEQIQKIIQDKTLTSFQRNELNRALIFHFAYKKDWKKVKKTCDSLQAKDISNDIIKTCLAANEKISDKKGLLKYYIRNYEFSQKDSDAINKVILAAESINDLNVQGVFVKKLSELNPDDNGIKYKLAGIYEKQKKWSKAAKVYENLMTSGDKSEHVKNSYAYVQSQLNPKKLLIVKPTIAEYKPKPLTGFKLAEKKFYEAWKEKNYDSAQKYLSEMLKEQPGNKKLLKHRVDIDVSQENYADSITYFEKIKTNSISDTKFLAFLYSKIDNNDKALEIIEEALKEKPENKELLSLALEYSMVLKNWDKAIIYTDKLLIYEPKSEKLLKSAGDLYSIKKDFSSAIKYYKELIQYYPMPEYQRELANFYMANKEFEAAQTILEPLYCACPKDEKIIKAYLDSLMSQQKLMEAYSVVLEQHLENSKEGYVVFGNLDMLNKHYDLAKNNYLRALQLDPENISLQNQLADAYRLLDCFNAAQKIYCCILSKDPTNFDARMGLGSIEIEKKNYNKARHIFCSILQEDSDYKPAKMGIAYSYIASGEKFNALTTLSQIDSDEESNLLKAKIYYDMGMPTDSKENLAYTKSQEAKELKYKIRRDDAITFTPTYSFLKQTLGPNFRLNYQMGGVRLAKNIDKNTNVFMNYNVYTYTSEDFTGLTNVTHEFRGGAHSRPEEKLEYHTDLGVKVFEFDNGSMIVTDDWIKRYINDKFAVKLGFYRDNLIQTYTSAVGRPINGVFTGRVADTRTYLEYEARFPKDFYSFGRACYGVMYAQNLPTNQYLEGMLGVGKLLYNNPKNPIIQKINFDLVTFNWTYQYNLLNLFDSTTGAVFGGYFSPNFFSSDTANLKLEGEIKKLKLKYGCTGFAGVQYSNAPVFTELTWGVGPYLSYKVNDYIDINASYQYFDWAFMKRHIFLVNAVIRGFKKNVKT